MSPAAKPRIANGGLRLCVNDDRKPRNFIATYCAGTARVRYPALELDDELVANVDHVFLSSEPYRFRRRDIGVVQQLLPRGVRCSVSLIDGEMTSWYGSRAIRGVRELGRLRESFG